MTSDAPRFMHRSANIENWSSFQKILVMSGGSNSWTACGMQAFRVAPLHWAPAFLCKHPLIAMNGKHIHD
jgi:hypothetical protein